MSEAGGAKARLELARDILKIRESLTPDASIGRKHLAANRIGAIRRVLLGRDGDMLDRLLSPAFARAELEAMASDAKDNETPEKAATTLYVAAMTGGLNALASAEIRSGLAVERMEGVTSYTQETMAIALQADAMIDSHIERGRIPEAIKTQMPALKEAADKALSGNAEELLRLNAPELFEQLQALDVESKRLSQVRDAHWAVVTARPNPALPENERRALHEAAIEAYNNSQQAYLSHFDDPAGREVRAQAQEVIKRARESLQAPLIEAAKAFTESVVQASPVTAEQAAAWAEAQDITPPARARLKKIGYDLKQLRQDMAEFYRFSGGRVVKVKVHSKGDRRANATGIEDHGKEGVIHLAGSFDKRVLWHELAHHIEADPVAKMAAGKFIRRRSVDGKAYSLRSLTKNSGYRSSESAFKDHFFDQYVGKIYNHGTTEVFSMGVESFSDPLTLGRRMAQDPETLEFVAGYLKQPIHPLAKAHMALRERLIDVSSEANEEAAKGIEQLQAELAAKVGFTPDTDTSWTGGGDISWYSGGGKQVGKFNDSGFYLFEAKVRNPDTKRQMAGYIVYRPKRQDGVDHLDRPRWSRDGYNDVESIPTRDLNVVKVAMLIRQKTGWFPGWYELNNEDTLKKHIQA